MQQKPHVEIQLVLTVYQPDSNKWPTSLYCYKATPLNSVSLSDDGKRLRAYLNVKSSTEYLTS